MEESLIPLKSSVKYFGPVVEYVLMFGRIVLSIKLFGNETLIPGMLEPDELLRSSDVTMAKRKG